VSHFRPNAATFYFENTPYASDSDIPTNLYLSGSPDFLEDFQDGTLDGGITASASAILLGGGSDSVFGDGGPGSIFGPGTLIFSFDSPVTAAGLAWTDGESGTTTVRFEAFGPGNVSLGFIDVGGFPNTPVEPFAEDRFFGVKDFGGITSIAVTNFVNGGGQAAGIEVDHVQYGVAAPEPGTYLLLGSLLGFAFLAQRRRAPKTAKARK